MLELAKLAVQARVDAFTKVNWESVNDAKPVEQNVLSGAKRVR